MFGHIILLPLQSRIFLKSHLHNVTWSWIFPKANRSHQSLTEDEAKKERRSLRWRTDLSLPETFGMSSNRGLLEFWISTISNPSLPQKPILVFVCYLFLYPVQLLSSITHEEQHRKHQTCIAVWNIGSEPTDKLLLNNEKQFSSACHS